jgi:MoxR-like ATPase
LEYMTKDTAKLSGLDFRSLFKQETGKDHVKDLGMQTVNGVSVRKIMTLIMYAKALAYFRGNKQVELEDIRQILPFVLHDTLVPYKESAFFEQEGHARYRVDRVVWIRKLFDLSCDEFMGQNLDQQDPMDVFEEEFKKGLENVSLKEVDKRLQNIEKLLYQWSQEKKLYGHRHDDILKLKYLHQRYTNYRRWLQWKK